MSDMRTLGNTAMKVVPVGLGCMGFSHAYGAPTQKLEAVRNRIDPKIEPETVAEVMAELIKEGKILSWGISETTEEYLREEGFKAAQELMKLLEGKAVEKNATKGQISLAWMLCKKPYIIPIPGSRKEAKMPSNRKVTDCVTAQ